MEKNIIYPALCYYIAMMLSVFQILPGCSGDIQKSEYSFPGFKETAEVEFEVISDELFGLNAISDITRAANAYSELWAGSQGTSFRLEH